MEVTYDFQRAFLEAQFSQQKYVLIQRLSISASLSATAVLMATLGITTSAEDPNARTCA